MAKKTDKNNKTMHVLSLLTADKGTAAQEDTSVKVIDSGEGRSDRLAEQIGEQLENALKEELQEPEEPQRSEEAQEPEEPQRPEETQEPEEAQRPKETQEPEEVQRPEEAQEPAEVQNPEATEELREPEQIQENSPEPEQESDYVFVNVMETIAKEHLRENQERFSTCTCGRCTMDVLALTLNTVQPRYVVVQKGAVSGLTGFYEKKYMTDLLVAMVQACIKVAKNPRH